MKKKLFLSIAILAALACIFAISAFAAEPDTSRETVTLDDGTVCALWDTDGNGLVWYKTSDGYAYISATDTSVDYNNGWNGGNQLGTMKITANGTTYDKTSFVVLNFQGGIKITSGQRIGNNVDRFAKTFNGASNLEYVYLPLETIVLNGEDFKSCAKLKYINIEDLSALTTIGAQSFNGCSSLFMDQPLDLSGTKLASIGAGGFATVAATEIILPSTLTDVQNYAFRGCKYATKITFNSTLTKINTSELFSKCEALERIEGFGATVESGLITSIGHNMFINCKKLAYIDGMLENGILIIPEGVKRINDNCAFSECDQIVYVEFPSTIEFVGQAAFSFCDNLTLVSFDKVDAKIRAAIANGESYTKVSFNNCGTFKGCAKLVAMSVPEGTTEIINRFVAQGCTSLTAFYMPNSVTSFGTNGNGQGPFDDATSLYFVNEPFTVSQCLVNGTVDLSKLNLPEKPSVYYMPTSLTTVKGHIETNQYSKDGTFFKNCTSINDVIVFGESFQVVNANNMFQGMGTASSPKTVVFTADITQFIVTNDGAKYITMVFSNAADKTPTDLGITRVRENKNVAEMYFYFCQTGLKYNYGVKTSQITDADAISEYVSKLETESSPMHVRDIVNDLVTEPTCTVDGGRETFCFCGYSFGKTEVIPMTGHDLKEVIDTYYPLQNGAHNYYGNRVNLCTCQKCADEYEVEIENTALFNKKGYSFSELDSSTFSYTIYVNVDAVKEYSIMYGILVSANTSGTPISLVDGKITHDNKTIVMEFQDTDVAYSIITAKLTNVKASTELHLSAYAVEENDVSYLSHDSVNAIAETVSHEILLQKYPSGKQNEEA